MRRSGASRCAHIPYACAAARALLSVGAWACGATGPDIARAREDPAVENGDSGASACETGLSQRGEDLEVTLCEADHDAWQFGAAETGAGVTGWYGEDCLLESDSDEEVCHVASAGSVSITLHIVATSQEVAEGSTLVGAEGRGPWSYAFFIGGECWTFGDDATYYVTRANCIASGW